MTVLPYLCNSVWERATFIWCSRSSILFMLTDCNGEGSWSHPWTDVEGNSHRRQAQPVNPAPVTNRCLLNVFSCDCFLFVCFFLKHVVFSVAKLCEINWICTQLILCSSGCSLSGTVSNKSKVFVWRAAVISGWTVCIRADTRPAHTRPLLCTFID